jgi:hypothetical protein
MKKLVMRLITEVQKLLLRVNREFATDLYYRLAKIHFKMHFGTDLETEVLNATDNAYLAAKRHSRLVLKVIYPNAKEDVHKKIVKYAARSTFTKNIILNAKL